MHPNSRLAQAQAEGAIEGIWSDYKMTAPFATDFKYSRFDATSAKHRDVSKLMGKQHAVGKATRSSKSTAFSQERMAA